MAEKFKDGLKVLMYGDIGKLKATMNRHFLDQLTLASDAQTQKPRTLERLNHYIREGNFTHVLIPDEHFHRLEGSLKGCIAPVVEMLGDHWAPWAIKGKKSYMEKNGVQNAIVFTKRFVEPYGPGIKFHPVPYGFDIEAFEDKGGERDIDVLIHGSLGEDTEREVYPVRNWLARVLPEIGEEEGLKVVRWEHPGYWPAERDRPKGDFRSAYSDILNRSKIAIGGSSRWRLPLKKFLEVPACGAILLSDLPVEEAEFFSERILEVDPEYASNGRGKDLLKSSLLETLQNYSERRQTLQPFRSDQDRFDKSYHGRALEMRAVLEDI